MQDWHVNSWRRKDREGTFFVTPNPSGTASATRVYGDASPYAAETIGDAFESIAAAMMACERRIVELRAERCAALVPLEEQVA